MASVFIVHVANSGKIENAVVLDFCYISTLDKVSFVLLFSNNPFSLLFGQRH